MEISTTLLKDVLIITPDRYGDNRGYFSETWNKETLSSRGIQIEFVQDNHSVSAHKGTIRGLHLQNPPHAQDKLVRCGRGALFDVAVDVRRGSPTWGKWFGCELSAENGRQLLVPKGFLHGFQTLTDDTEIIYKCSDFYAADCEAAVRYDDPDIGVAWPINGAEYPVVSQKDAQAPALVDYASPFAFETTDTVGNTA